ncbi:DUF72 domain-containing protein [uncultured Paludibaculum sp.]|uniref:DUF72 domain-containing protein n=1 Tax=uncultured Paludibaculum sp. TaxID=1765020 RepID=UPI002AAAECA8|nr:DUF72 domain-containing protein [uncultured Paludibaculum sp.]
MAMLSHLSIGPSGWHRADWVSTVYPKPASRGWHPLDTLARYVDVAEIGQTFAGPLKPEIARLYVKKVEKNPGFLFTALLERRFTYDRCLDEAAVNAWKQGLFPLLRARRLGAVVMQFPWAFRFTEENRQFLIHLRRTFHEFPLSAELRHESWLRDEAVTTLVNYRVGFVNIDQPQYFRALPPTAMLTSGVAVVRMHGRRSPEGFQEFDRPVDQSYLYDLDELLEWRPRIERLAANAARVLVVTANAEGGRSMVNALQLREIFGDSALRAPAPLIGEYPAELAAFRAQRPVQAVLLPARAA